MELDKEYKEKLRQAVAEIKTARINIFRQVNTEVMLNRLYGAQRNGTINANLLKIKINA